MYEQLRDENDDGSADKTSSKSPSDNEVLTNSQHSAHTRKTLADYGSTLRQNPEDDRTGKFTDKLRQCGAWIPCRIVLYVMNFWAFFCAGCLRSSISVALVAMVNSTAEEEPGERGINETTVLTGQCPRPNDDVMTTVRVSGGHLNWDRHEQALVLAAYFYGCIVAQISGGWLADHFGGKWLLAISVLVSSIVSLLTPAAAELHVAVVVVLRIVAGLGEGFIFPTTVALLARWSPPPERSRALTFVVAGGDAGTVVGMLLGGVLSEYGFAGGWPSVFYVFGLLGCVWFIAWSRLCYSSPAEHPRISTAERLYLETAIGATDSTSRPPAPWQQILTSVPVWALTAVYFANAWPYYTVFTSLPLFIDDIFGTSVFANGVISSMPFIATTVLTLLGGIAADWLRAPGRLSTTFVRKMFSVLTFMLVTCFFMTAVHIGCDLVAVEAAMIVGIGSLGIGRVYYAVNQLDLAPLHAGKLLGLTHAIALLSAVASPHVVGALTYENPTPAAWQVVFYIAVGIMATGTVIFCVFGSGERQEWADNFERQQPVNKDIYGKELSNLKTTEHSDDQ